MPRVPHGHSWGRLDSWAPPGWGQLLLVPSRDPNYPQGARGDCCAQGLPPKTPQRRPPSPGG